ncbi:hypothetical protein QFZ62_001122 [Clavibacter sp. B3I6]|nr:hypothetical protein [Clavibacter sp. B3I6]
MHDAVDLEGRVAAEHEARERRARDELPHDRLGLGAREQLHHVLGSERPLARLGGGDRGGLVDVGGEHDGLDARGSQEGQAGGGRGGEVEARGHAAMVARASADARVPRPPPRVSGLRDG